MLLSNIPSPKKTRLISTNHDVAGLRRQYADKLGTLRFIAIASVVWGHTLSGWDNWRFISPAAIMVQTAFLQLGRMGTIPFFIISGFFLADRLHSFTVSSYLKYRWRSIILPWLFFISLCVLLQTVQIFLRTGLVAFPQKLFVAAIFHAAYWFIPVSLFAACVLIVAKKQVDKTWFASLLVVCTVFYCINLYYHWIAVNHTKAVPGYTFFTWLGIQIKKKTTEADKLLRHTGWPELLTALFVMFAVSCGEALYLKNIGCGDAFASIRISNIILSLLLFFVFLKRGSSEHIAKLQPDKYVYGVYLIHSIVLLEVLPLLQAPLQTFRTSCGLPAAILLQLAAFVAVLALSYLAAVLLKESRLRRLIGR